MADYLFFCDIDGTLLCKERDIDLSTNIAIQDLEAVNCKVILCTGRSAQSTSRIADLLSCGKPTILFNGAMIHNFQSGQTCKLVFMDEKVRLSIQSVYELFPSIGIMLYTKSKNYMVRSTHFLQSKGLQEEIVQKESRLEDVGERIIKVVLASSDREDLISCQPFFANYRFMFGSQHFVEVVAPNVSKGSAALLVQSAYGVDKKNIFCAGDAENDLSLFEISQLGFAPENAMELVKKKASYIIPSCREGGIKKAFEIARNKIATHNI